MSNAESNAQATDLALLAVVVGNTNSRLGIFQGRTLERSERLSNQSSEDVAARIAEWGAALTENENSALVVASDNQPLSDRVLASIDRASPLTLYRVGVDLPVPIERALREDATPGQDRLLNALAAWDTMQQACVVVDAGTALTIDFVDGEGVFQGGAIAPGASMMLEALHDRTAALPAVALEAPDDEPFGKNTHQSMLQGVYWGIRGMVRALTERYAEAYEAYPPVIVTGSDAPLLFEGDELIDRLEPDLTLRGIECACRQALAGDDDHDPG